MQDADKKNEPTIPAKESSETPSPSAEAPEAPQPWGADSQPEPTPESTPEPESPVPSSGQPAATGKGGGFGTVLWTLLVVAVLGIVAYLTQPYWRPQLAAYIPELASGDSQTAQRLETLVTQQQSLDERLGTFESNLAQLEDKVAALNGRIESVAEQVSGAPTSTGVDTTSGEPAISVDSGLTATIEALRERTDALESEVATFTERAQTLEQRTNALSQVNESQEQLLAEIGQEPSATQVLLPRIEQLEADSLLTKRLADRLRELETAEAATQENVAQLTATVLAVNQLREALNSSGPYAAELTSLKVLMGDDADAHAEIATLEKHADEGVPSTAALRASFPKVASAISRTSIQVEGDGWTERTLNSITSLVSVRRTGSAAVAAGGTEGALAQAELALAEGDLSATVTALESLDDPSAAAAAQVWLDDARARLAANEAIADLHSVVIARLGEERS